MALHTQSIQKGSDNSSQFVTDHFEIVLKKRVGMKTRKKKTKKKKKKRRRRRKRRRRKRRRRRRGETASKS